MAYQVLARKWRPQDFSSLVGQGPIVTALRNAVSDGKIAQAYLFSGIRGVGKTSTARLLAKALNCVHGPTGDPCNDCLHCREITKGADIDVIEVDAATYSKVEQVRELTESLRYGPARDRYKVVVIDEIHRLSRQAFDALLKIVEEPPAHLVFIFATTESEAVPATILSRCQEFRFRRVTNRDLAAHLAALAKAESITVSDAALRLIARAGEGSVRDSVALLDQLATFGAGTIRDEDAARLAGGLDTTLFSRLLTAILSGDAAAVSAVARHIEEEGWDPRHVFPQFLAFVRDALHLTAGGNPEQIDLPADDAAALAELARQSGYENLLRLLHQLLGSEESVRRSEAGTLALEIALLRAAELPKLVAIEELLAGGLPRQPVSAPAPRPPRVAAPPPREPSTAPAPASSPPPRTSSSADPIADLRDELSARRPQLAAHLAGAERLAVENGELLIYLPAQPEAEVVARALERPANRDALSQAVERIWGGSARWRLVVSTSPVAAPTPGTAAQRIEAAVREHPTVQAVLEIFGGTVHTVKPLPEGQEE